jgi:C1A family cysteine protease
MSQLSEDKQAMRLGLRVNEDEMRRVESILRSAGVRAAVSISPLRDWRNKDGKDWTTPVRDQGNCGSCVAFATVATIEAQARIQLARPEWNIDLSEADLFFCGNGRKCAEGWWPSHAMEYARTRGVPEEGCFPYQDHDMDCEACADRAQRLITASRHEEIIDVNARKEFLDKTGPMVACLAVYRDFMYYKEGVYRHVTGDLVGYHAVSCVGYSESDQCWICKNSWGTGWGENGYFKIAYGEADIDTQFAMFGVPQVAGPLIVTEDGEAGDDWVEALFAEHTFDSKKNLLWAFVKGKWRYREVTESELAGLGGTLFEAESVRAFFKGERLDKLVGAKKY